MTNVSVYGIYGSHSGVEAAVETLRERGFRSADISVLFSSDNSTKEFAVSNSTKSPEGAATGALSGATVGGVLGWLAGIGTLAIPGVGPFIAAGPIMAAIAGAGVGGTLGGITGALIGIGIPEYEASRYEGRIKKGGALLSVHSDNSEWTSKAKKILEETGADDIGSKSEADSDNEHKRPMRSDADHRSRTV